MLPRVNRILGVLAIVSMLMAMLPAAALANPPYPGEKVAVPTEQGPDKLPPRVSTAKHIDQPNIYDYLKNRQRQELNEAGQSTQANAMALSGTDRVLVVLVEFAGTDVFTWTAGTDAWDPLGKADPAEYTGTVGDCSKIITQTTTFTYTGPLHNQLPRPLSAADRSGDSIWTEDFSPSWFNSFMFGDGVVFDYDRVDSSHVHEDFTGESVRNYYREFSNNTYNINGDIIGWLPLNHSTWYYGADQCPGARSGVSSSNSGAIPGAGNSRQLVRDALNAVNAISNTIPGFDWANYDLNQDGVIDRLWIVHSGYGEEDSTTLLNRTTYGESAMWSHSSAVTPAYPVGGGISAGPYIMMPENGGIGVFAHEYGHNLGADDLYAYGDGETSAGFWTVMADDWTGYPIGFEPPAPDPWHLDNWGWLNPALVNNANQVYTVTLGRTSNFPGGDGVSRAAKIALPTGQAPLAVAPWQGSYYWWGGKQDLSNGMMTLASPIAAAANTTLSFDLVYDLEDQWDYLWVQVSDDAGATWQTITNTNTVCTHVVDWVGGLYGFPDDLCAVGIGGFTNFNANWPAPELETFNLGAFAGENILVRFWYMTDWGTTFTGPFVDNVVIANGSTVLFSDNAEAANSNWNYAAPWVRSNGFKSFSHNYYLQLRDVSATGGYDSALGDSRWRYGPANSGLVLWYNNNNYTDNEVFNYLTDFPGFGPKGRMLVVDSHSDPYREPALVAMGYNNEGANVAHRGLMRDAPFSLSNSVPFTMANAYALTSTVFTTAFPGRPAVSAFHDAWGYYPGAENVPGGPVGQTTPRWMTKQWDASTNIAAAKFYGIKAPGYLDGTRMRFECSMSAAAQVLCYSFASGIGYNGGTGNPGDLSAQYGWHFQILNQTAATATVKIWNAQLEAAQTLTPNKASTSINDQVTYTYNMAENQGSALSLFACVPLDAAMVEYVAGSGTNGAVPLPVSCPVAAAQAAAGQSVVEAQPGAAVAAVGWTQNIATTAGGTFSFKVKVKPVVGILNQSAMLYNQGTFWRTVPASAVNIVAAFTSYLPLVFK